MNELLAIISSRITYISGKKQTDLGGKKKKSTIHAISFGSRKVPQFLCKLFNSSIRALISNACHDEALGLE